MVLDSDYRIAQFLYRAVKPLIKTNLLLFFFSSFFLLLRLTDLLSYSKEVLFNPFHETGTVSLKSFGAFVVVVVVNLF